MGTDMRTWRKRRPRADLTLIEEDAERRQEAASRVAGRYRVPPDQVAHLRATSDRLAKQNRIAEIIKDAFGT